MATFVRVQEVDHAIGAEGSLTLRVTSADVELRTTEGDTARARIEFQIRADDENDADAIFEGVRYDVEAGNGRLEISEPKRGSSGIAALAGIFGRSSSHVESRVTVEVPASASVAYSGVSGDLLVRGLRGEQQYRTVSGDLVLGDVGGALRIHGVSGDVSLRAEAPIALRANTVSGDLSAIAPRIDATHVVTVSGDVELEGDLGTDAPHRVETVSGDLLIGAVGGLTLEVRGLSSDVSVSLAHRSEGTRDRRRYVIGDGAASVQFSSMSGDALVRGARRVSGAPVPPRPTPPPSPPAPPIGQDEQLAVLRALEAGEIDVDEATRRLAGGRADG